MKKTKGSEASLASMYSNHSVRINMEPDAESVTTFHTYKKRHSIAPVVHDQLQKIKSTQSVGSITRETKHFCETTTMHGPKRIYGGKGWARILWLLVYLGSATFLIAQIGILATEYIEKPTVSQVSFFVDEEGILFPSITICNFNPVKRSNIEALNKSGDFPYELFDYMMESNMDAAALFSTADRAELRRGDNYLQIYQQTHQNFSATDFFMDTGFNCKDFMMTCTFAGRDFDCCQYSTSIITNMGKCQKLNLNKGPDWMKKQISAGLDNGLQVILDARDDEILSKEDDSDNSFFSTTFETGFRFYVHNNDRDPNPSIEGISVSPSTRVYTALSIIEYHLLSADHYGNCTRSWPVSYGFTTLPYTTMNCETLCKARYFNQTCGCSPAPYNIAGSFRECTPLETVTCMDSRMKVENNGAVSLGFPLCIECKVECDSTFYNAFNSYGHEFNPGSLKWLSHQNFNRTAEYIKRNFLTMNVFFRDLTHVEYTQTKASSITELLSNIGGNMGMFLGMSIITIAEGLMYLFKIAWIAISRKRREYMFKKKEMEKEQNNDIEETVRNFKLFKSKVSTVQQPDPMELMKSKIRAISTDQVEDDGKTRQASEDSGVFPL